MFRLGIEEIGAVGYENYDIRKFNTFEMYFAELHGTVNNPIKPLKSQNFKHCQILDKKKH